MKKFLFTILSVAATLLFLVSCNGDSVDTVKSLEEKNFNLEGKEIELTGQFDTPFFTISSGKSTTMRMVFMVKSHAMSSEELKVSDIVLAKGEGKNSVTLDMEEGEKNYTLKNFNIYDQDGEKYNLDTHPEFKIKGTVRYAEMKKPEENRNNDNFSYEITDVVITKN